MPAPRPPLAAALILAAGGSRRMGRPKALLPLPDGRPLLRAWLDLLAARCAPRVVVGGAETERLAALLGPDEALVINADWASTHMADSLVLGLAALPAQAARVVVTPVDLPPPALDALDRLLAAAPPAALSWSGRPGHPVLLGPETLARLRSEGAPPGGLRALVPAPSLVPGGPEALLDLDTPARWARFIEGRG